MKHTETIIRTIKDKNNPYVMLDRRPLQNKWLSWKAKGLLAYFMSLPSDWNVCMAEIQTHSTDGTASFRSGIKELKDAGYLAYAKVRDKKKRISKHIYFIRENLQVEFPDGENLIVENPKLLISNSTNKGKRQKDILSRHSASGSRHRPSTFDKKATTKLHKTILTKKNINLDTTSWPNTFRLLRTKDKVENTRIKEVLIWYSHHLGEDYVPVAHCAKTFRAKFTRIEDAMDRADVKKDVDENGTFGIVYRKGHDGVYGYFDDSMEE